MDDFSERLTALLLTDTRLVSDNGELLKSTVQELALKNDPELLSLIASEDIFARHFFFAADKYTIFDQAKFIAFISNKSWLPDSYTKFKNKIGLSAGDAYLSENSDVVLTWPYKDAVLEGGMTGDEAKRSEIFYNEVLAPDQITRLLANKAFSKFEMFDATRKGERITASDLDEQGFENQNFVINGNNLLVLASLRTKFRGKVKLIYIDPPYNTDGPDDSFRYNDSFNHSTWLTFMKNRLEIARDLLTEDGAIYVQLDYNEVHYCKVLMDEIFGRENFEREVIWRIGWVSGYKSIEKNWIRNHDTILFYAKNRPMMDFKKHYLPYPDGYTRRDGSAPEGAGYPFEDTWNCYEIDSLDSIAIKSFSKEKVGNFKGQKNEALIKRIIEAHTIKGDIVLDFFGGTGTTAAVAHKMGRRWIIAEQIESQIEIMLKRLSEVIDGSQTGVSAELGWKGGGSFVYLEFAELNSKYCTEIRDAIDVSDLLKTWDAIRDSPFLSHRIDARLVDESMQDFRALELGVQKQFLMSVLDKNALYVNLQDAQDSEVGVDSDLQKLNALFYGEK